MSERTTMNGKPVYTVPSKTTINFDSGFKHKLLCDGPTFTLGTACAFSCSFCYVPDQMRKLRVYMAEHGVPEDKPLEDIVIRRKDGLETLRHQLTKTKIGKEMAAKKLTIYASPLVDVAANMELAKETIEACHFILENTKWDIRLLSKSNLLPKVAQALSELDKGCYTSDFERHGYAARVIYGVSTGTLDDKLAAAFEQGTAKVSKRIESLHWLQDNGYRTFGMICPSLPMSSPVDYLKFAKDSLEAIRAERCEHVWAEVLNVRGESIKRTYDCLLNSGFKTEASLLGQVFDKSMPGKWEEYARSTFAALQCSILALGMDFDRLRFMQYVTKDTRKWWTDRSNQGAVVL